MAEVIEVEDDSDSRLDAFLRLRDVSLRQRWETENGIYLAEGEKVIRRALGAGHEFASFLLAPRWLDALGPVVEATTAPCFVLTEAQIEQLTGFHVHRGALAAVHRPAALSVEEVLSTAQRVIVLEDLADHANVGYRKKLGVSGEQPTVKKRSRIAVLENLVDHANVGACFRSAAAMGVDAVLVTPQCADPLYRRSVKVSMGTVFQVPWTRIDDWPSGIRQFKDAGYVVAGMTLGEGAITLDELVAEDHQDLALVFGSEGQGLTPQADRLVDRRVTIPMLNGVDSLNVAASSAVAFYATR